MKGGLYELEGKVQHYAWGGQEFIAELFGLENTNKQPFAELWMGIHPRGPSAINVDDSQMSLSKALQMHPEWLGKKGQAFGKLPFLFKVLDVKEMLSIQSHPDKRQATRGFAEENQTGVPIDAPHRNFKDDNHKPELMVALSEFWLLHGFKRVSDLDGMLRQTKAFESLIPSFAGKSISRLYKYVMELPQEEVDQILGELELEIKDQDYSKDKPEYWVKRAMNTHQPKEGRFDRGIFSIYFLNLVKLRPGEGIFQGAGIPHAYLEGKNVELMASSDNVFRGGLTKKHIDVPCLLDHLDFESILPKKLFRIPYDDYAPWDYYDTPAKDFQLRVLDIEAGQTINIPAVEAPQILLFMDGQVRADNGAEYKRGDTCFIPANSSFQLTAHQSTTIFNATLP